MDFANSTSSEAPLGIAAQPRRVGTNSSLQAPSTPRYRDFGAVGVLSLPEPPTSFLTYMYFLAEHKHEVPVVSSVRQFVDKDRDKIGSGATFSVYKGSWRDGKAAFKYLNDGSIPEVADRYGIPTPKDGWVAIRRKRQYDSAMKSLMFEIKIMAKKPLSQHQNIVRLLGISWDEDEDIEQPTLTDPVRPVLIVELAWEEYPDLESYVNNQPGRSRLLNFEEALAIAADVADGLAALHSFGVIHGDLKPGNVLLFLDTDRVTEFEALKSERPPLVAKIGDFGFSGTVSLEEDVCGGTHFWNAPECLSSCQDKELKAFATHQTRDIYSFGLLLVYLLIDGESPFDGIGPSLAAIDRAKLEDQIGDHCRELVRNSSFCHASKELADEIDNLLGETLRCDPNSRRANIGGVRHTLTGADKLEAIMSAGAFTRATFFSIHIQGVEEPMSYGNIDLSAFWRGSETQIPYSRKRLLRRGVDLEYIKTLTKPERRSLFFAGHAFVNAERVANGQPPFYPRTAIHSDYLKAYSTEECACLAEDFAEATKNTNDNITISTGTEEESMIIDGLSYYYKKRGILGATISLKTCIELDQILMAKMLLRLGKVSVQEEVASSFSLLHLAAMCNSPDFVHLLVERGLNVNQRGGEMGLTPLHEAIRTGNFEAAVALLDCGADLEAQIKTPSYLPAYTPLEFAIQSPEKAPKILSLLLESGAKYGHTTLNLGALEASVARPSLLKVLLDHDSTLARLETRRRTILHAAVIASQAESVRMLLERGADPNARDLEGKTPLATLSSINKLGTFLSNGIFSDMMGVARQTRAAMFNPEHWGEIQQLLVDHGGEEPDDYMNTADERKLMEAAASYIYWLDHIGTHFWQNAELANIVRDITSGGASMDPSMLFGLAIKSVTQYRSIILGYLKSVQTLGKATKHLPVGSEVLGITFSTHYKEYFAVWGKPVDWDGFIDFMIAVLRYLQDPKEPELCVPEGITDEDLDHIVDENGKPLRTTGPIGPLERRILEHIFNTSLPNDYDAAMECLTFPFAPELPKVSSVSDEIRQAFDKIKVLQKSATKDPSTQYVGAIFSQFSQILQSSRIIPPPVLGENLLESMPVNSNTNSTNYQPKFLSALEPQSPIFICSINPDPPNVRKLIFGIPVFLVLLVTFFLLCRMFTWLRWLTFGRLVSLILLNSLHRAIMMVPLIMSEISFFATIARVSGWLASGRLWQPLLEYYLTKTLVEFILYNDPNRALIKQISFRWRYGFPEVEPLILSHAQGKDWKYDFALLLEGVTGKHGALSTWRGWIERPDAIAAVLDEWEREEAESLESTIKLWDQGWWYYIESTKKTNSDATSENQESEPVKAGHWRKFNFIGSPKPDRYLKAFAKIEKMFHAKVRPELYQQFRELFPQVNSAATYRVLENAFAEYPDIIEATQSIFID